MKNRYEGMRDSVEYDQMVMKSSFNWAEEHMNARKPLCNKWDTLLGKLVCPSIFFSPYLMDWMIHNYNLIKRVFESHVKKIAFFLNPDQIENTFHLNRKCMPLDLSVAHIIGFGYIFDIRQARFFEEDEGFFGKQSFPLNMVSFKSWA